VGASAEVSPFIQLFECKFVPALVAIVPCGAPNTYPNYLSCES